MNILEEIVQHKKKVLSSKKKTSVKQLENYPLFKEERISLKKWLQKKMIVAEIKFSSPSQGKICPFIEPEAIAIGYQKNGAAGISVLTEEKYFAGKNEYLSQVRKAVQLPLLRKDFIIDEYQILESRALGADVILLIASSLKPKQILEFSQFAHSLQLEVLLEVHSLAELESSYNDFVDIIGVNNRNLKTLQVSLDTSLEIVEKIPPKKLKISESGLSQAISIKKLIAAGFDGFLIGESLMKTGNPALALQKLLTQLEK